MKDQSLVLYCHLRMQMRDADEAKEKQRRTEGFSVQALKIYQLKLNSNNYTSEGILS